MERNPQSNKINISRLEAARDFAVSTGEVESLSDTCKALLHNDGLLSRVNGVESIVTNNFAEVEASDGTLRYARVFTYTESGLAETGRAKEDEVYGLVIDENRSINVLSINSSLVLFRKIGGKLSLVVDSGLDPRVNDVEDATLVARILSKINSDVSIEVDEKRAVQKEQDRLEEIQRREKLEQKKKETTELAKFGALTLGIVGATAALGFGTIKVLGTIYSAFDSPDFDDTYVELPNEAAVLDLGDMGVNPLFVRSLVANDELSDYVVPTIRENYGDILDTSQTVRDAYVFNVAEGDNCAEIAVDENVSDDSQIYAWTDFISETGESREADIELDYTRGEVRVCFVGDELDEFAYPRVLLKLVDPNEVKTEVEELKS